MTTWKELRCPECGAKFLVKAEDAADRDEITCPLCDDTVELPDESDSDD